MTPSLIVFLVGIAMLLIMCLGVFFIGVIGDAPRFLMNSVVAALGCVMLFWGVIVFKIL